MFRYSMNRPIAFLLCLMLFAQRSSAEDSVTKSTADEISNRRVSFIYSGVSLADAMESLSKQTSVPIKFDQHGLDLAKVTEDSLVSGEANRDPFGKALDDLLAPLKLTHFVMNGYILITDREQTGAKLVTKVYPVADLLKQSKDAEKKDPRDGTKTSSVEPIVLDAFADIIRANVSAHFQVRIQTSPSNGSLVIVANQASHEIVEKLLRTLRSHKELMSQHQMD